MSGSGPRARIRPTPDSRSRQVRLGNTTANLCATSTCCAVARAPRRDRTFDRPTGTFFRPRHAGNFRVCDWRWTHERSVTFRFADDAADVGKRSLAWTSESAERAALQAVLRPHRV